MGRAKATASFDEVPDRAQHERSGGFLAAGAVTSSQDWLDPYLRALGQRDPLLAHRLCLPVDGSHVQPGPDGRLTLTVQQSRHPLALPLEAARAIAAHAPRPGATEPPEIFVFGAGAGELAEVWLAPGRAARVTVWDRDPWMLRLTLERADFSAALVAGRLRLSLGSDLFAELPALARSSVVSHPLLAQIYRNERLLLEAADSALGRPRALICAGGLFVDDVADALRDAGHAVFTLDAGRLAIEELALTVEKTEPRLIAAINYTEGLGEFCAGVNVPLLCWEIDPSMRRLQVAATPPRTTRVFTYRRAHVDDFHAAGFPHVEFLPLASSPQRRARPAAPLDAKYRVAVAFVGASLADRVAPLRAEFLAAYEAFHAGTGAANPAATRAEGGALFDELLARQRLDFSVYSIPPDLEAREPGLRAAGLQPGALDVAQVAAELAAGEKRLAYVAALAARTEVGIDVWGDPGWDIPGSGVRYHGSAGHFVELNKIYSGAQINIDIGRLYQMDIVTMRVFDVLSCGGFLLAERCEALLELFEPGVHLDVYRDRDELVDKVAFYLARPALAARMAEAGRALVHERHSLQQRVRHMLATLGE